MNVAGQADGVALTDEQRLDWLRLIRSENVGPRTFRTLIDHFGGARGGARGASRSRAARRRVAAGHGFARSRKPNSELAAARRKGISFVALGEPDYPVRLRMIDDAPPLIALAGHLATLTLPMIAIVGSRNASAAGAKFAERIARNSAMPAL